MIFDLQTRKIMITLRNALRDGAPLEAAIEWIAFEYSVDPIAVIEAYKLLRRS